MIRVDDHVLLSGFFFFFSSRRRHTRSDRDWSSDVCSSDLLNGGTPAENASAAVPAQAILSALTSLPAGAAAPRLTNAHEGAPTCSECGMLMEIGRASCRERV